MFFDIHKADAAAFLKTVQRPGHDPTAQGLSYAGMGKVFQLLFPSVPVIRALTARRTTASSSSWSAR